jgi:hypothetical protein
VENRLLFNMKKEEMFTYFVLGPGLSFASNLKLLVP